MSILKTGRAHAPDTNSITASPPTTPGPTGHSNPVERTSSPSPGPNPAPISSNVNNPSDGYPRRRPKRQVTLEQDAIDSDNRRGTTDSHRSHGTRQSSRMGSRSGSQFDPNASVVRRMTASLFTPEKPVGEAPTYMGSIKAAVMSTWLNVLLVFIPIGWALYLAKHNGGKDSISDTACFITNFIAIIPLAGLLGFATEEAALRCGQTLGGLLNATLGNAVELIVAILALIKCELAVVQSSLIGSILSNILLVLGMCFFAGGVRYAEQTVKSTAAQLNASLLLIAVIAVLIPSAFHFSIETTATGAGFSITNAEEARDLLAMSHAVAVILLVLYLGYLLFQMWTHAHFYQDDTVSGSTRYPEQVTNMPGNVREKIHLTDRLNFRRKKHDEETTTGSPSSSITPGAEAADGNDTVRREESHEEEDEEEEEIPQLNVVMTITLMVLITVLVGVTAEFLVDSINGLTEAHPSLSKEWVGLILLPIVGNAAEHFTAVSVSVKDKLDLSISVAVGSSIQIALFVIPVIELLAWSIGKPMTLLFDPYESIVVFLSVLIVNQTLSDGRSNWMEGLILMFVYLIIAVSFWYYPGSNTATLLGCGE